MPRVTIWRMLHGSPRHGPTTRRTWARGISNSRRWDEIEDSCMHRWPIWSSNRYRRDCKDREISSEVRLRPTASEASDLLWSIVQAEKAYRHAPFLYSRSLVKGSVDALNLIGQGDSCDGTLDTGLVPRTMLSLAYTGGPLVWEQEMESLCAMIPQIRFTSMRQIEDCTRSLKICRHKTDCVATLDQAVCDVLNDTGMTSFDLVSLISQGIVYQRCIPYLLFQRVTEHLSSTRQECREISWKALGTLGASVAYADCLAGGRSREARELMEILMEIIDRLDRNGPSSHDLHRLHPFLLWYSIVNSKPYLLEDSIAVREDAILRRSHTISTFQKEVYDILKSYMGLHCSMEQSIHGISVDITIPGKCVALEVNGPSHYYRNACMTVMVPGSEFKEQSIPLIQPGWRLCQVQQQTWDTLLLTRKDKADYLRSLIYI